MANPAKALAETLSASGTTVAFGLPGGGPNLDVVGALHAHNIDFVLAHTETAACIMAATWGYLSDRVTAAVVTRGPGAASAVNGAAQATLDRYPLLLVTDTVPTASRDRVPHQRIDQQALFAPVTKASVVLGPDTGVDELRAIVDCATSWPPGAVHLDYDATSHPTTNPLPPETKPHGKSAGGQAAAAAELISAARRPVVIVGAAAVGSAAEVRVALETYGAPVLSTYQAVGIVETHSTICAGLFTNGASERPLLDQADLIIAVGLDLVEPIPAAWNYDAPVVSISPELIADPYLPISAEVVASHERLAEPLRDLLTATHDWETNAGQVHNIWVRNRLTSEPLAGTFRPVDLVGAVAAGVPSMATVTVDAGAHFLAIMPLWPVKHARRLLISNGLATMGFAVPAAIGAAIARPDVPVVALTGDGGLGMCLAELETIARRNLPVTVVVFNDAALSLIEIKQTANHGGPSAVRYATTDFASAAGAMGMAGVVAHSANDVADALAAHDHASPLLIDARIDPASYPHLMRVTRG